MLPPELIAHLPQNWIGWFATIAFVVYIGAQVIEKFEGLANALPGGKWWHERQKAKRSRRIDLVTDDNEIIQALQEQVTSIVAELASVRETLRIFTAWSVYDARWHHQAEILAASTRREALPHHLDYFAFEEVWKLNPAEASRLPA